MSITGQWINIWRNIHATEYYIAARMTTAYDNTDESYKHCMERKNPDTKENMLPVSTEYKV